MGMRLGNGNWSDALADTPENQQKYGQGSGYQGSAGYGSQQYGTGGGSSGGGSSSGGTTTGGSTGITAKDLDAQFEKMLKALASGNKEAFEFEKSKFNQQFTESKRQFDLGRGDSLEQFAQNFGLSVGEMTGMYNGQPTENARQFNMNLGKDLLDAATKIRGPKDYLQYQEFTRGGQNLMQQLQGNQPIPEFGAPTGQMQSANIQSLLQDLGIIPGGTQQANRQSNVQQQGPVSQLQPMGQPTAQARMYGQYNLDQVAQQVAQMGGDVNRFNQLMNDTSNPSSLNWALQQATGGKIKAIEQLGPAPSTAQPMGGSLPVVQQPGPVQPRGAQQMGALPVVQQPGPVQPRSLDASLSAAGGGTLPGFTSDPRQQLLQRFGLAQQSNGQPQQLLPHQIDPARWDAMGQIGQDLTKNLAETQYGYDAQDFERQVNATRPKGTAPRRTAMGYAQPRGLY